MKPFLIEEKDRDEGYSRLREQREQKQRYANVCLSNGHQRGNEIRHKEGEGHSGT